MRKVFFRDNNISLVRVIFCRFCFGQGGGFRGVFLWVYIFLRGDRLVFPNRDDLFFRGLEM